MLTRDLLRYRIAGNNVEAQFLRATPAIEKLADALLAHWKSQVGQRMGDIQDGALPILHQSRALVIGRGLQKIITDACTISDPEAATTMREHAFNAAATLLAHPQRDSEAHAQLIADKLQLPISTLREQLYGDLPDQAQLTATPPWSVSQLLDHYNMALAQGLVLFAHDMHIEVHDADIGVRRRLLKAMRFRRLLATVKQDQGPLLRLQVSGPGSVLEQANRYGMQLAQFLPALATCKKWQARADLRLPRAGHATLLLSNELQLRGDTNFIGYVPKEIHGIEQAINKRFPQWILEEPPLLTHASGEIIVPDLCIRHDQHVCTVEFFHRWHGNAVERRITQMADGWGPQHIIGIERSLVNRLQAIIKHPIFEQRGFLFRDFPTVTALGDVVSRLTGTK